VRHPARAHATAATLTSTLATPELDHVLIAVADLAAAGRELEARHGLASIEDGRHAGYGTANRIVPLGDSYLELITVADESEAARSPFGSWVARVQSERGRPLGWAVRTHGLDALARRLEGEQGLVPLEVRWLHDPDAEQGFVGATLASNILRFYRSNGSFRAEPVIEVDNEKLDGWPLPGGVPGLITDGTLDHVVRTRIFVTDFADFDEIARAHREVFGEIRPATSMVEISALIEPAYVLEIEADAVIG
jgi:Glyoxalase-like domain/56kDa selenium binding protein (SBP56)/Endoribonuclease L-PSP